MRSASAYGGIQIMNRQLTNKLQTDDPKHLVRPRINRLLEKATQKPLVIVCAGAGYGKTRAVYDFTREDQKGTLWVQLSDHDNAPSRFWENYVHSIAQIAGFAVKDINNLGFPDTDDKFDQYISFRDRNIKALPHDKYIVVFDDFHLISNPDVMGFIERIIHGTPASRSIVLICREDPRINITALKAADQVFDIQEDDLNFTENELSQYLTMQGLSVSSSVLRDIYKDIGGWAFSVNLVARSLAKSPGYSGYARNAMKMNIFELMESEVYSPASERLKRFLVKLSLVEHLSRDLIDILAEGDEDLMSEFRQQSAYIRYDINMNAYLIHHLFLDFLRTKQDILNDKDKEGTYRIAAGWCEEHNYIIDAIGYYEKIKDYEAIIAILSDIPFFLPHDLAVHMLGIFDGIPEEMYLKIDFLAVMHLRTVLCLAREEEFNSLAGYYIDLFLALPESSVLRKHSLGLIYYFQGLMRLFMSASDGRYDFDEYFEKMHKCLSVLR